jgi:histidinol-phosphate aminotransferase
MNPEMLLRPHIRELAPYVPILPFEALSRKLGRAPETLLKLDANENPYGPLPAVLEALHTYPYYHIYPDPQQTELREALAHALGVPTTNILPTHGADEMIDLLCRLFAGPDERVINCPPTFGMYEFDAALQGAQVIDVPRTPDFSVDVDAIERCACYGEESGEIPPKLLFLTSPNNPSGNLLPDDDLRHLLALPTMVVLDEAYIEFADFPSRASWVLEHNNLVVLRTFSKAAGIAGLRLGYAISPAWLMPHLMTFKQPYNVNVAATVAGLATLRHPNAVAAVVDRLKATRARLFAALAELPWLEPWPSHANFILANVVDRDAHDVKQALEARGVLVRHYNKPGLRNCIRISVGTDESIPRLLRELRALDASPPRPTDNLP